MHTPDFSVIPEKSQHLLRLTAWFAGNGRFADGRGFAAEGASRGAAPRMARGFRLQAEVSDYLNEKT